MNDPWQATRRKFLATLGAAGAWPLAARAQQPGKLPTIGFLGTDASVWSPWTAAFVQRLRELGWTEGRNIAIEYRWSEGRPARHAEIAAEFVRMKVDVIVNRRAAEQRDEVAAFYLIELHSVPSTRTGFCMISNWQSSVSGYRGRFATGEELSTATAAEGWTLLNAYGRRVADVPDAQCDYSRAAVP
jgi:hypothetical protein